MGRTTRIFPKKAITERGRTIEHQQARRNRVRMSGKALNNHVPFSKNMFDLHVPISVEKLANSTEDISKRMRPIVPIADEIDYIPIVTLNDDMFEAFLLTSNNTKEDTPNFNMVHTTFAKMFSKSKEPIAILITFIPIISTNLIWGTATETHVPNLIRLSKVFPVNVNERTQACNIEDGVPSRVPFLAEVIAKIEQNPLLQIGVEKLVTKSTINHTPPEAQKIGTVADSVKGGFGSLTTSLANIRISEASSHSLVVCHYAIMSKTP
ncbi:putative ribonuclease H protein [Senna tora]|uniref:Putative ribonuclease H protein n=1 Tax=Senna tora TaxID=362788 RepID=A0A834TDP8_9FABA|nr:putative ribonuclease H protein [Senna tora]